MIDFNTTAVIIILYCLMHLQLCGCVCVCLSDECVPLGCMMVNSVARLCPLLQPVSLFSLPNAPSLSDLDWDESERYGGKPHWCFPIIYTEISPFIFDLKIFVVVVFLMFYRCFLPGTGQTPAPPHFDSRSRIFELDSCGGNGKVCLIYKNCTPGVLLFI